MVGTFASHLHGLFKPQPCAQSLVTQVSSTSPNICVKGRLACLTCL